MTEFKVLNVPLRHLLSCSLARRWVGGVVCRAPHLNGACAKLTRIADHKSEDDEKLIAGRTLEELPREQWPCCVEERAAFMAPFEMEHVKRHALAAISPKHYGHFQPTLQRYPAYSVGIVPFRWMMKEKHGGCCDLYDLDIDKGVNPTLAIQPTGFTKRGTRASC